MTTIGELTLSRFRRYDSWSYRYLRMWLLEGRVESELFDAYEIFTEWVSRAMQVRIVTASLERVYENMGDNLIPGNKGLLPEALGILRRSLCLCGGSSCVNDPSRICYNAGLKDVFGKYVCDPDTYFYSWYSRICVTEGGPVGATRAICSNALFAVDAAQGAIAYSIEITPDRDMTASYVILGTRASSSSSGNCCLSCPTDSVSRYTDIPVAYWAPSGTTTLTSGNNYIVKVLLTVL